MIEWKPDRYGNEETTHLALCECNQHMLQIHAVKYGATKKDPAEAHVYLEGWEWGSKGGLWQTIRRALWTFWYVLRNGDVSTFEMILAPKAALVMSEYLTEVAAACYESSATSDD